MSFLSFLETASVEEVTPSARAGVGGARKPWNPPADLLCIRVWKDGAVFPSQALIDRFNLDYPAVTITKGDVIAFTQADVDKFNEEQLRLRDEHIQKQATLPEAERTEYKIKEFKAKRKPSKYATANDIWGNGFDFIDSRLWAGFKGQGALLFVAPVSKDQAKVDIFGSTKYTSAPDEDTVTYEATAVSKVYDQGSKTFGASVLLPTIKEVYGIDLDTPAKEGEKKKEYIDMLVVDEVDLGGKIINFNTQFSQKLAIFPKKVLRGEAAGNADYEKRENATVWGFLPAELLNVDTANEAEATEKEAVDAETE